MPGDQEEALTLLRKYSMLWEMSKSKTTSLTTLCKEAAPHPITLHLLLSLLISFTACIIVCNYLFICLLVCWMSTLLEYKFHKGRDPVCLDWCTEVQAWSKPSTHICWITEWPRSGHCLMMCKSPIFSTVLWLWDLAYTFFQTQFLFTSQELQSFK